MTDQTPLTDDERDAYASPGTSLRRMLDAGQLPWPTRDEVARELAMADILGTGRGAVGHAGLVAEVSVQQQTTPTWRRPSRIARWRAAAGARTRARREARRERAATARILTRAANGEGQHDE